MSSHLSAAAWEAMFAPYDPPTYRAVLDFLNPEDRVLDIGAGDLRLAVQMARYVNRVYAIEINASVLEIGLRTGKPLPANLVPICSDARTFDFPPGITVGVLMMRHCTNFRLYAAKLRAAGAQRLVTNTRWRMSVESVDLLAERIPFHAAGLGWYACQCGATGFKEGPAEQWAAEMDHVHFEVANCPQCM